jgi:hypothetical protein
MARSAAWNICRNDLGCSFIMQSENTAIRQFVYLHIDLMLRGIEVFYLFFI